MAAKNNERLTGPFWGARDNFIQGRNQLGLQSAGIGTFAVQLPGLTTLTNRLRYYGFYPWLLDQYASTVGRDSIREFRTFLRRGELLYAFLAVDHDRNEPGIAGSNFAARVLQSGGNRAIDLAGGASLESSDTYFGNRSGAFGQYYYGSLANLGLVAPWARNEGISVCTDRGRNLAETFRESLGGKTGIEFVKIVRRGRVERAALTALFAGFDPDGIKAGSSEWREYKGIFLGPDYPGGEHFYRRGNIAMYLEYVRKTKSVDRPRGMPEGIYGKGWASADSTGCDMTRGWYYYQMNEYCQYALSVVFWGILTEMAGHARIHYAKLMNIMTKAVAGELKNTKSVRGGIVGGTLAGSLEKVSRADKVGSWVGELMGSIPWGEPHKAMAQAVVALLAILSRDGRNLRAIRACAMRQGMWREGDSTDLLGWMSGLTGTETPRFLGRLMLEGVIHRHIEESFRKMRNTRRNGMKLLLEDGVAELVMVAEPSWTSPRLDQLHRFLVDLKCIDPRGNITREGLSFLAEAKP